MPIQPYRRNLDVSVIPTLESRLTLAESSNAAAAATNASHGAAIATKEPGHPTLDALNEGTGGLIRNQDGSITPHARQTAEKQGSIMSWSEYQQAKLELIEKSRGRLAAGREIVVSSSLPGGLTFYGGLLLPNGNVFIVPYNSTVARAYDRVRGVWNPAGAYPGAAGYVYGTHLPDGRIYLAAADATSGAIYDPYTNITTFGKGTYSGGRRAVLINEAEVFITPWDRNSALIYNFVTDSLRDAGGQAFSLYDLGDACLLPDGRVFLAPFAATRAEIYDPVSDSYSTPSHIYGPENVQHHISCQLMVDGRVFVTPFGGSTTAHIYDPVADTLTPKTMPFSDILGCPELPDGRLFLGGLSNSGWYDPFTDTSHVISSSLSHADSCLLPNGDIVRIPFSSTNLLYVSMAGAWGELQDINLLLSPWSS